MADENLLKKVHGLSDLELAALLCLVSREHCVISTPADALDDLVEELQLISSRAFGLRCVTVSCHPNTTLEDFATALLVPASVPSPPPPPRSTSPYARNDSYFLEQPGAASSSAAAGTRMRGGSNSGGGGGPAQLSPLTPSSAASFGGSGSGSGSGGSGGGAIANVVLAKNLDRAPRAVQIQALELLRTRRIFTRTAVQAAPKPFLFVAVLVAGSGGAAHVTPHLNDFFYIAHWHDPADGFANLEETAEEEEQRRARTDPSRPEEEPPLFSESDIGCLAKLSQDVQVDVDVLRYQMNIVSFLRIHRAVGGGVTPAATKHFEQLMRGLAPLHRLDFVTPSLVAMAAKKVYIHRIRVVEPPRERSLQWGSELAAVEAVLAEFGPEEIIDDVLAMVAAPL